MDNSPVAGEIAKLEEKIRNSKMPPELLERVNSMLSLLKLNISRGGSFVDLEKIATYINWVTEIPFESQTKDNLNLVNVKQILDKNHYGLESVKEKILDYLSSLILNMEKNQSGAIRAPIICLVGLVGTGKTTLAYSISEALGRSFQRIPFGGMGSAQMLRGQSRILPDAEPGQLVKKLVAAKSRNCVILLDELDRITELARTDIMGTLVELLDPEQNFAFTDHYIDYPVNLSNVLFVATANNTTNISQAVLDRLEIIQMPSYSDEEKMVIGKNYLLPKIVKQTGLSDNQIKIDDSIWPNIIRPLGFDSGIRSLERTLQGIAGRVARLTVEGKIKPGQQYMLSGQNIQEFLPV